MGLVWNPMSRCFIFACSFTIDCSAIRRRAETSILTGLYLDLPTCPEKGVGLDNRLLEKVVVNRIPLLRCSIEEIESPGDQLP